MQSRLACTLVSQANLSDLGKRAELGKTLATELLPIVSGTAPASGKDSSTAGLVEAIGFLRKF